MVSKSGSLSQGLRLNPVLISVFEPACSRVWEFSAPGFPTAVEFQELTQVESPCPICWDTSQLRCALQRQKCFSLSHPQSNPRKFNENPTSLALEAFITKNVEDWGAENIRVAEANSFCKSRFVQTTTAWAGLQRKKASGMKLPPFRARKNCSVCAQTLFKKRLPDHCTEEFSTWITPFFQLIQKLRNSSQERMPGVSLLATGSPILLMEIQVLVFCCPPMTISVISAMSWGPEDRARWASLWAFTAMSKWLIWAGFCMYWYSYLLGVEMWIFSSQKSKGML